MSQYTVEVLPPLKDDLFFSYYRAEYDHLFSEEGQQARCLKVVYIFMGIMTVVAVVLLVVMLRK
jgi:hypothetical protein